MDVEIHCRGLPCADQHHTQQSPERIIKQHDPIIIVAQLFYSPGLRKFVYNLGQQILW